MMFEKTFTKYDEQDVADAVEMVIRTDKWFPSIARIKEALDERLNEKRSREQGNRFQPIHPRAKIDMAPIHDVMDRIKNGEYKPTITDKVRAFAKRLFPDINDELIRRNLCVLTHYYSVGAGLDGGAYVNLYMTKTGEIVERVVIPG